MKLFINLAVFITAILQTLTAYAGEGSEEEKITVIDQIVANFHNFTAWSNIWWYSIWFGTTWLLYILGGGILEEKFKSKTWTSILGGLLVAFIFYFPNWIGPGAGLTIPAIAILAFVVKGYAKALHPRILIERTGDTETEAENETEEEEDETPPLTEEQSLVHCNHCNRTTPGRKHCEVCNTPRNPGSSTPNSGSTTGDKLLDLM